MKTFFFLLSSVMCQLSFSQNVGIGITTPAARLHVSDSSVLFSAAGSVLSNPGNPPIQGTGRRMMWYADKAAFRTGYTFSTSWDKDSIGDYSFASGSNSKAIADWSTALGNGTIARGVVSTAMGYLTIASGEYSTATGTSSIASGSSSTAMGNANTASGHYSTAIGYSTIASGLFSTALGNNTNSNGYASTAMEYNTTASADYSTAIGFNTIASGDYSVAIGRNVSTNAKAGAFFFGDSDPNNKGVRAIGTNDQFATRFNGGYYFISSDAGNDIGVRVLAGGNSWSTISDINRKENFLPVNGESFLQKISKLHFTSWNYKGQDAKTLRHYGPMAQDFYKAFGKDDLGTIGCDTLINQQDFLGINLIAIQALEKRTTELKQALEISNEIIIELKKEIELLKNKRKY